MWDMIYAFGIGISFSIGIGIGILLCQLATKSGHKELKELKEYRQKVLEFLATRSCNDQEIIAALYKIADR